MCGPGRAVVRCGLSRGSRDCGDAGGEETCSTNRDRTACLVRTHANTINHEVCVSPRRPAAHQHIHPTAADRGGSAGLLTCDDAAALLGVVASTLLTWELRLGYPQARHCNGATRLYDEADVTRLHAALQTGLSVTSAIRSIQ
jgi:hypothetical protein